MTSAYQYGVSGGLEGRVHSDHEGVSLMRPGGHPLSTGGNPKLGRDPVHAQVVEPLAYDLDGLLAHFAQAHGVGHGELLDGGDVVAHDTRRRRVGRRQVGAGEEEPGAEAVPHVDCAPPNAVTGPLPSMPMEASMMARSGFTALTISR